MTEFYAANLRRRVLECSRAFGCATASGDWPAAGSLWRQLLLAAEGLR